MKRLFLGLHAEAPWPEEFPSGRIVPEKSRHLTLAFLGNVDPEPLIKALSTFPKPPFPLGLVGYADQVLFLPPKHPHVVAYHVSLDLEEYQKSILDWLKGLGYDQEDKPFLPHVTVARSPTHLSDWHLPPIPMVFNQLHIYESLGNMEYVSLWNYPLKAPFEEKEHTADVAFDIRGKDLAELYLHAQAALAFLFPPIYPYFQPTKILSFEEIVMHLNRAIAKVDAAIGCAFKAVSYHGEVHSIQPDLLEWEMIVDV